MTSDTDDTAGRRPPTIELAATEVDDAAEKRSSGPAETAGAPSAENEDSASDADARRSAAGASGRFTAYVAGAAIGAAVMAAIAGGVWFAGLIPMTGATPAGRLQIHRH